MIRYSVEICTQPAAKMCAISKKKNENGNEQKEMKIEFVEPQANHTRVQLFLSSCLDSLFPAQHHPYQTFRYIPWNQIHLSKSFTQNNNMEINDLKQKWTKRKTTGMFHVTNTAQCKAYTNCTENKWRKKNPHVTHKHTHTHRAKTICLPRHNHHRSFL